MFPQQNSMSDNIGLKLKRFQMWETGTYNRQWRRPYNTKIDGQTLKVLNERLQNYTNFTPAALSGIANQFISPSTQPELLVPIKNDWNTPRIRFMMEIEHTHY